MHRANYYRLPAVFYLCAAIHAGLGACENESEIELTQRAATEALMHRYPDTPQSAYVRGLAALERQDYPAARRHFESALSGRLYTNEGLLHTHARLLDYLGESPERVDRAVALWRKHFPHSVNPDPREYR